MFIFHLYGSANISEISIPTSVIAQSDRRPDAEYLGSLFYDLREEKDFHQNPDNAMFYIRTLLGDTIAQNFEHDRATIANMIRQYRSDANNDPIKFITTTCDVIYPLLSAVNSQIKWQDMLRVWYQAYAQFEIMLNLFENAEQNTALINQIRPIMSFLRDNGFKHIHTTQDIDSVTRFLAKPEHPFGPLDELGNAYWTLLNMLGVINYADIAQNAGRRSSPQDVEQIEKANLYKRILESFPQYEQDAIMRNQDNEFAQQKLEACRSGILATLENISPKEASAS